MEHSVIELQIPQAAAAQADAPADPNGEPASQNAAAEDAEEGKEVPEVAKVSDDHKESRKLMLDSLGIDKRVL